MTTEAVRTEVLHDTVVEQVYIRTADTLICRDTIREVVDTTGKVLGRETVRDREVRHSEARTEQKSAHHEEQHEATQKEAEREQLTEQPKPRSPLKPYLWGVATILGAIGLFRIFKLISKIRK